MTYWKHIVTIDTRELAPDAVAKLLAVKLLELPEDFRALEDGSTTLDDIAAWLTDAAAETPCLAERVDEILRELYDWANANRLWVYLNT